MVLLGLYSGGSVWVGQPAQRLSRMSVSRAATMIEWDQLVDRLSAYVETLNRAADATTTAKERPRYTQHLATAALIFAATHRRSLADVRRLVADERRSFGWDYLTGDVGNQAESEFDRVASLVESFDDAG